MQPQSDLLDDLVTMVLASSKYRHLSPDIVRTIGDQELRKRRSMKEAVKATKSKLHQVAGMYLPFDTNYADWLAMLATAYQSGGDEHLREVCRRIMAFHVSTRERLPILDQFYTVTLEGLGPIHRILDLASGLNPLSLCWMPLADNATYFACDVYDDMVNFLNDYFALEQTCGKRHISGNAFVGDVIQTTPPQHADVALILKAIPCLEQVDKTIGMRLLDSVRADHLLVSFPIRSLGGKAKGMEENYEARFYTLVEGTGWSINRFAFATELVFRISK